MKILTPPHTRIWHSQMRVDNDILVDGWRTQTQKEPKRQSNKCSRKSKGKGKTRKKRTFSQETMSSKRISDELNPSNKSQTMKPHYLGRSPSSRLIRGPRPMTPTQRRWFIWLRAWGPCRRPTRRGRYFGRGHFRGRRMTPLSRKESLNPPPEKVDATFDGERLECR